MPSSQKYGFSFEYNDNSYFLADGTLKNTLGKFDVYYGLKESLYVDIGLDLNRTLQKIKDDSKDKWVNRDMTLRGGVYYRRVTKSKIMKGGAFIDWTRDRFDESVSGIDYINSFGLGVKGDYYFMSFGDKFYVGTGLNARISLTEKVSYDGGGDYSKSWFPIDVDWRAIEFNIII